MGVVLVYLLHNNSLYSEGPRAMIVCFQTEGRLGKSMKGRRGRRKREGERGRRDRGKKRRAISCVIR